MKTQFNSNSHILFLVRAIAILSLALLAATRAFSQWRPNGKNFFVGTEIINSSRSFSITSDQPNMAGAHVLKGTKYAVIFGTRAITGKVRLGDYATTAKEPTFKANGYEVVSNFQPLQFLEEKPRVLEPYLTFSLEGTTIHTSGTYTAPPAAKTTGNASGSGSPCSCTCPNTPPSPPKPDPGPVPYSGKVVTTRGNVGVGLKLHIEKAHVFFNVFTEFKYGIALGNYSSTEALLNTYSLAQKGVDVGVSMGFVRNKSIVSKLRRTRFR